MLCGWEGNRRSGVALAMHHTLQWVIHLRAHGLSELSTSPILFTGYGALLSTLFRDSLDYYVFLYQRGHDTHTNCSHVLAAYHMYRNQ